MWKTARKQAREPREHPLFTLDDGELELVLRLVLASGSLKDVSQSYGVSYPTLRARLDRLIERLRRILDARQVDPMSDLLATLVERGEITVAGARAVQELYRNQKEG